MSQTKADYDWWPCANAAIPVLTTPCECQGCVAAREIQRLRQALEAVLDHDTRKSNLRYDNLQQVIDSVMFTARNALVDGQKFATLIR